MYLLYLFTVFLLHSSTAYVLPSNITTTSTTPPLLASGLGPNCPMAPFIGKGDFAFTSDCGAALLQLPQNPAIRHFHSSAVQQPGDAFVLPLTRTYGNCRVLITLSDKALSLGQQDVSSWAQIGAAAAQLGLACMFTRGDSQPLMAGSTTTGEGRRIVIKIDRDRNPKR